MADETKNDKGSAGSSSPPKDWKIPDPAMPGRKQSATDSTPASASQPPADVQEELEYSRSPMLGVLIAVVFGGILLFGVAAGYYYYTRYRSAADSSLPPSPTHWIAGQNAETRFVQEWSKARVMEPSGFAAFAHDFWTLQEAYQIKPYDKKFENIEDQKTKIFKDFVKDDLMALEVPYSQFYTGEKSPNTDRYQLQLSRGESQMGDGGYRILRALISFKLPDEMLQFRLATLLEQRKLSPDGVHVRALFSVYHAEASADVQQVRPMDLPAGAKRFNAINRFVLLTKADVVLAADLMGFALVNADGSPIQVVMKGYPEAAQ